MASSNQGGNRGGSLKRGFASMDPERQREIASEGGKAAHEKGTAHEFNSQEAREAGKKSHGAGRGGSGGSRGSSSGASSRSDESSAGGSGGDGTRGGSSQQHSEAGRQSHKNDNKR